VADDREVGTDRVQEDMEERRKEASGEERAAGTRAGSIISQSAPRSSPSLPRLAAILAHLGGTPAEIKATIDEAARRQSTQDDSQKEANARDTETAALTAESQDQLEHHHRFAVSVTLFQDAIGLAATAALLRWPAVWYGSLGAAACCPFS